MLNHRQLLRRIQNLSITVCKGRLRVCLILIDNHCTMFPDPRIIASRIPIDCSLKSSHGSHHPHLPLVRTQNLALWVYPVRSLFDAALAVLNGEGFFTDGYDTGKLAFGYVALEAVPREVVAETVHPIQSSVSHVPCAIWDGAKLDDTLVDAIAFEFVRLAFDGDRAFTTPVADVAGCTALSVEAFKGSNMEEPGRGFVKDDIRCDASMIPGDIPHWWFADVLAVCRRTCGWACSRPPHRQIRRF